MNRKLIALALSASLLLCGCGGTQAQTEDTTKSSTTTPKDDTVNISISTTTTEATTTPENTAEAPETTTQTTDEPVSKTLLWEAPNGEKFYLEDAKTQTEYYVVFDYTVARESTGVFNCAFDSPELFDAENYEYFGNYAYASDESYITVREGDKLRNAEITSIEFTIAKPQPDYGEFSGYPMSSIIRIDSGILLDGIFVYFNADDYGITTGDVAFVPDSSFKGLPVPQLGDMTCGTLSFFGGGVYSDAPVIRLGNFLEGTAACDGLADAIGNGKDMVVKKATVTISELEISWNDSFNMGSTNGKIKDIEIR